MSLQSQSLFDILMLREIFLCVPFAKTFEAIYIGLVTASRHILERFPFIFKSATEDLRFKEIFLILQELQENFQIRQYPRKFSNIISGFSVNDIWTLHKICTSLSLGRRLGDFGSERILHNRTSSEPSLSNLEACSSLAQACFLE